MLVLNRAYSHRPPADPTFIVECSCFFVDTDSFTKILVCCTIPDRDPPTLQNT